MALSRRTGGRSRLTIALLVLTSIALLTLDFRDAEVVQSARRAASTVFSPFRGAAETVASPDDVDDEIQHLFTCLAR